MKFYRLLVFWVFLAVIGALAWHLLTEQNGELVLSWGSKVYSMRLEIAVLAWLFLWFAIWALMWLVLLPFRAWKRPARRLARNRLINGMDAMQQGRWSRAESLLLSAASEAAFKPLALRAAAQAAHDAGSTERMSQHLESLRKQDPIGCALFETERCFEQKRYADALVVVEHTARKGVYAPRALNIKIRSLMYTGRAHEAMGLLNNLRKEQGLPAQQLAELEIALAAASLAESAEANMLWIRWSALPRRLQDETAVLDALARRAAVLGLDDRAADELGSRLDRDWRSELLPAYALLNGCREHDRLKHAEQWLDRHSDSPELLSLLGAICQQKELWGKAEEYMHRAIAQGAGADVWEQLGQVLTQRRDEARAMICYVNALRVARGEPVLTIGGRSLREQIADEAVAEERDAHGVPRLRS